MQQEHHQLECEHVVWLEDLLRWRTEHRRAAAMLAQVQAALLEHEAALEAHAETVRAHQSYVQRQEQATADPRQSGGEDDPTQSGEAHQHFHAEHDRARQAHRRIRAHHELVTAEILRLAEKLNAPM
jgi:hypothetical protein